MIASQTSDITLLMVELASGILQGGIAVSSGVGPDDSVTNLRHKFVDGRTGHWHTAG